MTTMIITPNLEVASSTLNIDQNGDGAVDKTLSATPDGITIYDETPPEISISFSTSTEEVIFSGTDASPITVTHTSTSTKAADTQGNTSVLHYTKYKENPTKLKFSFNQIIRNGIAITTPNTHILYDWKLDRQNNLKDLDTKVTIKGVEKYTFSYKKSTNTTTIKEKTSTGTVTTTRQGFVAVTVNTEGSGVRVDY